MFSKNLIRLRFVLAIIIIGKFVFNGQFGAGFRARRRARARQLREHERRVKRFDGRSAFVSAAQRRAGGCGDFAEF